MHCDSSYIDYTHWYMHFRYIFSKQPMRNLNCAHEWLICELRNLSCIYLKPFNKAKTTQIPFFTKKKIKFGPQWGTFIIQNTEEGCLQHPNKLKDFMQLPEKSNNIKT